MIWEPLNCGSYFEKMYLWLYENVLDISLKRFAREYEHFRPEVQTTLKTVGVRNLEEYYNGLSANILHQFVLYYDNIVLLRYNK